MSDTSDKTEIMEKSVNNNQQSPQSESPKMLFQPLSHGKPSSEKETCSDGIHHSKSSKKSQQFCLKWNNYQTNLTNVFDQMLQSESFVDVTLVCDGNSIKAHKMVLSACSPYFQSLFFGNPCQHPTIIMRDVKWTELQTAIEFMYKGEINVSQEEIAPLLRVAEMLKIRGLSDVNGDTEFCAVEQSTDKEKNHSESSDCVKSPEIVMDPKQELECLTGRSLHDLRIQRKRPWTPLEKEIKIAGPMEESNRKIVDITSELPISKWDAKKLSAIGLCSTEAIAMPSVPRSPSTEALPSSLETSVDGFEIKPEIAEMIREEERAKFLEHSNAWLGTSSASASASITESYQYQLQSMWQRCWSSNQAMMNNLRSRERGPLKSWRPDTMAEAIFSVLKDGLSLSQAARKYDIPYPTFVLYANRVHNMLGPSVDGGFDIRPKGRGRPQRILLGAWPDELIRGVIKAVVFRDGKEFREDVGTDHLASNGMSSPIFQDGHGFPMGPCNNFAGPRTFGMESEAMPLSPLDISRGPFSWNLASNEIDGNGNRSTSSRCSS